MPTLTVKVAGIGTPLSDGGVSKTGHMWYEIRNDNGETQSYGFAPAENGQWNGPGEVSGEDSAHYTETDFSREINISQQQYDALDGYGSDPFTHGFDTWYNGIDNSCVDFVWGALSDAGLNPGPGAFEGNIFPQNNIEDLKKVLGPGFGGNTQWSKDLNDKLLKELQKAFGSAESARSPIVLDLDGDGVETVGLSEGVHFDHDANGFAESTGWISKDDGFLVWDRNGNGAIDDGTELFGNNTNLASGEKAANGFLALASVDDNSDGTIDTGDSIFDKIKVWVDKNTDGVSQFGELISLSEAGVLSLSTSYFEPQMLDSNGVVSPSIIDENSNQHRQVGSYIGVDGKALIAEDVWFVVDGSDTIDLSYAVITSEIARLPDIEGFGNVHDLHQAMALDIGGELKNLIQRFAVETDSAARQELMLSIMYHWAGVEDVDPASRSATQIYGNAIGDARKLATLEAFLGQEYLGTWCWGQRDPNPHGVAAPILLQAFDNLVGVMYSKLMLQTHLYDLWSGIKIETTKERVVLDVSSIVTALENAYGAGDPSGLATVQEFGKSLADAAGFGEELLLQLRAAGNAHSDGFQFVLAQLGLANTTGSAQNNILNGTDQADFIIGLAGNDNLYGSEGDDYLVGGLGNDYLAGGRGADTYEFSRGDGADTIMNADLDEEGTSLDRLLFNSSLDTSDIVISRSYYDLTLIIKGTSDSVTVQSYFDEDGLQNHGYTMDQIVFSDGTVWTAEQVRLFTMKVSDGNDRVWGGYGNDRLEGLSGNDTMFGMVGNDDLFGGAGDDWLDGGRGNDRLYGGEGDDYLEGGDGDDYLEGGYGADRLQGGYGSDSYHYSRGDGNDVFMIMGNQDRIQLGAGIEIDELRFTRDGFSLFITDLVTGQILTVDNVFENNKLLSEFVLLLSDGSSMTMSEMIVQTMSSTSGADLIIGYITDDVIRAGGGDDIITGGAGGDVIYGEEGDDTIVGDDGNDYLYGGEGDDNINGGFGLDVLDGGVGKDALIFGGADSGDTVVFGRGYDQDVIQYGGAEFFTIKLDSYSLHDIVMVRENYDLVLYFEGGNDRLKLEYAFDDDLARFGFAIDDSSGRTVFLRSELLTLFPYVHTLKGTEDGETLSSESSSDLILGYGGDDYIYGAGGDDWIEGGAGNDYLNGGRGKDTYVYHEGDGADFISADFGGEDTIIIHKDIDPSRITFHRVETDLVMRIDGSKEQRITIAGYYGLNDPTVSKVNVGGVEYSIQELAASVIVDPISDFNQGSFGDDVILGGLGDDTLFGFDGNDFLSGGGGSDSYLYAGLGAVTVSDTAGDNDVVVFYNGANSQQILAGAARSGNDLTIDAFGDGVNIVTVKDFFKSDNTVEAVMLMTGESISRQVLSDYMGYSLPLPSIGHVPTPVWGGEFTDDGSQGKNIFGSQYDDYVVAGNGNDVIWSRGGNDYLKGRGGSDTYIASQYGGEVSIDNSEGGLDDFDILNVIDARYQELWFSQSANDLVIDSIGTEASVTIENWFGGQSRRLDLISAQGYAIDGGAVDVLVQAMASFGPAARGEIMIALTADQQYEVRQLMAVNWQSNGAPIGGVPT
ncbi:calcium-binding protein [Pseudomonas syringae]|uniref:calcium-binding protein n=1 Tax=Pseudomonas syringae TaxID=317 RepID=UPI0005C9F81E|nr:calcium-binding protein [Pseudomonas syringae]